jgi:hypothetical protein
MDEHVKATTPGESAMEDGLHAWNDAGSRAIRQPLVRAGWTNHDPWGI